MKKFIQENLEKWNYNMEAENYKSRSFCRKINCPAQKEIDIADTPSLKEIIKNKRCVDCMAHRFHQFLKEEGYMVIREEI